MEDHNFISPSKSRGQGQAQSAQIPDDDDDRRGGCNDRSAGFGAGYAVDRMAHGVELSQVARYYLRDGGRVREVAGRDDRRPLSDPRLRPDGDRAGPLRSRRGVERQRRSLPHRLLLLLGQGSDLRLRHRGAVRAQLPHAECVDVRRRRHRPDECVLRPLQHLRATGRQHGHADGRLVPQGDQQAGGLARPEDPHRRSCRRRDVAHRRGAAADRRRRHISRAGEGHDRRGRVGRTLRRREARVLQGRQVLLLPWLVGGAGDVELLLQRGKVESPAQELSGGDQGGRRTRQHEHDGALRHREPEGAGASRDRRGRAATVLGSGAGCLLQRVKRGVCRDRGKERRLQEGVRGDESRTRARLPVVPARGSHLRHVHDDPAAQGAGVDGATLYIEASFSALIDLAKSLRGQFAENGAKARGLLVSKDILKALLRLCPEAHRLLQLLFGRHSSAWRASRGDPPCPARG